MSEIPGWICPRCRTVYAPWVDRCTCTQNPFLWGMNIMNWMLPIRTLKNFMEAKETIKKSKSKESMLKEY